MSFVMVDVESDGPIPGDYSMISFAAMVVNPQMDLTFKGLLRPISERFQPEALAISGHSREETLKFEDPTLVMGNFRTWLKENVKGRPMFISDNNIPGKGTLYEGGVNVPCIIRYPRRVPAGRRSKALVQNLDFASTIFDACLVTPPASMKIEGKSLMPLLIGAKDKINDELFFEIGWTKAVCTEQWKYLALRYPESAETFRKSKSGNFPWLYHGRALEPHQHHALLRRVHRRGHTDSFRHSSQGERNPAY